MKNFTVVHILLLILMMLVYQCTHAQDFVITAKGDTLFGKVRPFSSTTDSRVQLTPAEGKKQTFNILQTRGYLYKNEFYTPVRLNNRYVFMKVLKPGYLSLYAFQLENQVTYDGRYLGKRDGTGIEVPNLVFKKATSKFLSDCPSVAMKIESGELGKKELEEIVDQYNNCLNAVAAESVVQTKKIDAWDVLEQRVREKTFDGKTDALDMISEIKSKIKRKEKIPSFMLDGLKSSLSTADLSTELQNALNETTNQ